MPPDLTHSKTPSQPAAGGQIAGGEPSPTGGPIRGARRRRIPARAVALVVTVALIGGLATGLALGIAPDDLVSPPDAGLSAADAGPDATVPWNLAAAGQSSADAVVIRHAANLRTSPLTGPDDSGNAPGAFTPTAPPWPPAPAGGNETLHVPVLTYHVIAPAEIAQAYTAAPYEVAPAVFESHLRALHDRGWRTISASRLAMLLTTGGRPPEKAFVITIDDGTRDGITWALPIIQRYGFVATYYIVPGRLGIAQYMSWDDVLALQDAGMDIGNHTFDHQRLPTLTPDQVRSAIRDAGRLLADRLGEAPTTFSYPFGAFNDGVVHEVGDAGILVAFTVNKGTMETWANRLTLPRIHTTTTMTPDDILSAFAAYH